MFTPRWVKTNSGIRDIPNALGWPRHCKNAKDLDLGYFQTTSNLNLHESKHKTSAAFVLKLQSDSRTEKEWSARFLSVKYSVVFSSWAHSVRLLSTSPMAAWPEITPLVVMAAGLPQNTNYYWHRFTFPGLCYRDWMLKFDMLPWRLVKRRHDRKLIIKQNSVGMSSFHKFTTKIRLHYMIKRKGLSYKCL